MSIISKNRRGKPFGYLFAGLMAFGAAGTALASDWTDANNVTYTALKSINGGGSGTTAGGFIITDITPAGTETVKFKIKTSAAVSANGCVYCARSFTYNSKKKTWSNDATQFTGFRLGSNFRIDRKATQMSLTDVTCTSDTEYSVSADNTTGAVTINNAEQNQNLGTDSYTPGGKLSILACYYNIAAPASPTASSSWGNYLSDDLYYLQLWSSVGVLEHNFMPAMRDTDSVVGLYDTVTRKFWSASKNTITGAAKSAVTGSPVKWTGAGDGVTMSSGANWEGGNAPQEGDDLDFTIAVPNAEINANIGATFGKLWLGDGDGPVFTGSLSVTSVNDGLKVRGAVTIVAYYNWNGSGTNWSDADAWTFDNVPMSWSDGVNAVFGIANATATLSADASANSITFTQPAAVAGTSTLTVPSVSVAPGVAAAITAPTAGPLGITGGGTLTLGSSRSAATTLSEGTLAMSGSGTTLDWSNFTLGTAPETPVIVRFEDGAALANASAECNFGNVANITSTICKASGDWTRGTTRIGRANGANTTFVNEAGNLTFSGYMAIGVQTSADAAASSELAIAGGTVSVSNTGSSGAPYISVGSYGSGIVTVTNNATFSVALSMALSVHSGSGTLNVSDGGTAIIGTDIGLGWSNNDAGTGTINLGTGGTVVANTVRCVTYGRGVINFDGGTLKAGAAGNLIQASDRLTVNVGANGGTIDNDGKNITISKNLSGSGTINLIGSGATAFAAGVGSECGVSVSSGTTLKFNGEASIASLALAADSTNDVTAVLPIALSGSLTLPTSGTAVLTFNGGAFPVGVYRLFTYPGAEASDGAKFAPETDGETATWSVVNGALILTVGNVPNTWIGGSTGSLSDQSNWSRGVVPGRGETAAVGTGLAATFTVGASFSPDVIIIPEWSADVTFSGENAITGLVAVTNLSGSVCTFEVPVSFKDEINVYQTTYYYCDSSGEHRSVGGGVVRFAGGVTGTSFAEGTSRRLDGAYTISATAGWVANNSAEKLWTLPGDTAANGSSLTITGSSYATPGTTDTSMLLVGSGGAFTTGVVRTSNRVSYRIYGEYVVTEELEVAMNSDTYIAQKYYGTYKLEKLTLVDNGTGRNFYVGNSFKYNGTKCVYIGAGGINVNGTVGSSTAIVLGCGNQSSYDVTDLYPWHSDYTIGGKGGTTRDIVIYWTTNLHTDDESGVARTVTLDGIADVRSTLTVNGHGKLQVNSDGVNSAGNIIVTDAATLAYAPGADLGAGAVSVGANATLKVAGSGTVTVAGGITLAAGATLAFNFTNRTTPTLAVASGKTMTANGAVTVKVDGVRPKGGTHVLTTCGGFDAEGVTVSLEADAPKWIDGISVNGDGNIVLSVKPKGMVLIVK